MKKLEGCKLKEFEWKGISYQEIHDDNRHHRGKHDE